MSKKEYNCNKCNWIAILIDEKRNIFMCSQCGTKYYLVTHLNDDDSIKKEYLLPEDKKEQFEELLKKQGWKMEDE